MYFDREKGRYYCKEAYAEIELDRFTCESVSIQIFERKHYYNGSMNGKEPCVPSDDFSEWTRHTETASISLPAKDIMKLAEIIRAAQAEWMQGRPSKNHLNFMERIAKCCKLYWIGVNATYETIKAEYGERGEGLKIL